MFVPEILYEFPERQLDREPSGVRWLSQNELEIFNAHLTLCDQRNLSQTIWDSIYDEGTMYCLLFVDNFPVARACVEKYSADAWEVADVRVVKSFRNKGLAFDVCSFVLRYILEQGKTATIRTEEDNYPMQKVIDKLGFVPTMRGF